MEHANNGIISGFTADRLSNRAWLDIIGRYRLCDGVLSIKNRRVAVVTDDVPLWDDSAEEKSFNALLSALPHEHFGAVGVLDIVPTTENVMEQLRSIENARRYMMENEKAVIVINRPSNPGMLEEAIIFPNRALASVQKGNGFDITRWLDENR